MDTDTYHDITWNDLGVIYSWPNTIIRDYIVTSRGSVVEMIERPKWGIACYMNNAIQSCEVDEKIYHEALVHPIMNTSSTCKNVMIIGGGEGATAREVLKWDNVHCVDMYEWDKEVVTLFKEKYPQWAKGAWNDPRLTIYTDDIFEVIINPFPKKYDIIIIDLFDPEDNNYKDWNILFSHLTKWLTNNGSIVMYSGMRNILDSIQPYQVLIKLAISNKLTDEIYYDFIINKEIIPYKVFIPSFLGESTFILIKNKNTQFNITPYISSHITDSIWNSYKTFNS
jgi:spermidine synthase